jgi:hypothetical protein
MPPKPCLTEPKLIAQTLFLGASVSSFNTSLGWGNQPSQLTVNLIEDDFAYGCGKDPPAPPAPGSGMYDQYLTSRAAANPRLTTYSDNHYYTCAGDACYINKPDGVAFNNTTHQLEDRILPGKVYYALDPTAGLVSRYWTGPDPGFFGRRTRMMENGTYNSSSQDQHPGYAYDIIDTPVYFRMGNFGFGGFVQSWNRTVSTGGKSYSVIVNSAQSILNSCYVIVDKYAGSIFSKSTNTAATNFYGTPKNYVLKAGAEYNLRDISRGVMPNVFNVYGFLESFGVDGFGVARPNDNGVSINRIVDGLIALTSITHDSQQKLDSDLNTSGIFAVKKAFSPFGRIISKCMTREDYETTRQGGSANNLFAPITPAFNEFGVINPQDFTHLVTPGTTIAPNRCQFVLDLADLIYTDDTRTVYKMPDDIRVQGPVISIMDLINIIAEQTGHDVTVDMVPTIYNQRLYHVIKVRAVSRLQQPRSNTIDSTIKLLQCSGYPVSSNTSGKEKNETNSRAMIIGGPQQRLLQIQSYRLAYTQSSFVFDPRNKKFINYFSLKDGPSLYSAPPSLTLTQNYGHGKVRFPNFGSTRNPALIGTVASNGLEATFANIIKDEYEIQKVVSKHWDTNDTVWKSTPELNDGIDIHYGNYNPATKTNHTQAFGTGGIGNARWFPIHLDLICPFFGYVHDSDITLKTSGGSTDSTTSTRDIRPVFFDTWTGQLAVVIRVSELPVMSVNLTRAALESEDATGTDLGKYFPKFPLPYTYQPTAPNTNTAFNSLGVIDGTNVLPPIEYFVLTESEIRAALAGFDNFLVYSLAKTYKPDLIEMVRRAYFVETRKKLVNELGLSAQDAIKEASDQTDWYWKLLGSNIAGDTLYPTVVSPDKNDGSQYIQEKALQDLKIIHRFITEVGKYYGKKYMVHPGNGLQSYRDESLANIAFPTNIGYGYAFSGDGKITYNYEPTNDGAWEEYGNIIDDGIVVGGSEWYNLSDDQGKIKPLLGYNNNYYFDYIRHAKCEASKNTNFATDFAKDGGNPYFSYSAWLALTESKRTNCADSFVFPSLDFNSLGPTDYVVVDQKHSGTTVAPTISSGFIAGNGLTATPLTALTLTNNVKSYDPWNVLIVDPTGTGPSLPPMPRSKLYTSTSVEEGYVFLDPGKLLGARILIDAPGLILNVSTTEHAKDPNRTVLSNIAAEDLIIYLKTTSSLDWDWIRYMLNYITPASYDDANNPHYLGLYTVSSNSSANNVELAPKAAHPFFAGIPIKSNQFVYGPWINYPDVEKLDIYPTGITVSQTNDIPPVCTDVSIYQPTAAEARLAIENLITATDIEVRDDFVPWNYGGTNSLDIVAYKEIESKVNYQSVIETAQIDMPGLPLFDLGGIFSFGGINYDYTVTTGNLTYIDVKKSTETVPDLSYIPGAVLTIGPPPTSTFIYPYTVLDLKANVKPSGGPMISNIQCSVGQQGISTSYSFRTYSRKIGLFNKEESDRIKKINLANLKRNKQIVSIGQELKNVIRNQKKSQDDERLDKSQFGSEELSSKLFGWSPSMVLIGQASPYIAEPSRTPAYVEDFSLNSTTVGFQTRTAAPTAWSIPTIGTDPGDNSLVRNNTNYLTTNTSPTTLKNTGRVTTTVQLYERKEVGSQLDKDYGTQSAMSLDGLLSPISFYPTYKNATFSYSVHMTQNCPFCFGTKVRKLKVAQYDKSGTKAIANQGTVLIVCDKCGAPGEKLNSRIKNNKEIPINLITLNPIVVPYGEFKNTNTQNYSGAHPEGVHDDISSASTGYGGQTRHFRDRMRHCIEIVARGSVPPNQSKYALETSRNLTAYTKHPTDPDLGLNNLDYSRYDAQLFFKMKKLSPSTNRLLHENNQRFFGLRGPLVLHSWGYDADGYPIPNAADEPYAIDVFGRPKRFKLKIVRKAQVKYKTLSDGDMFELSSQQNTIFSKSLNNENLPIAWANLTRQAIMDTMVIPVFLEDDLSVDGGFEPENNTTTLPTSLDYTSGYKGSIISKTQKFINNRWTPKYRLKEFYLNWAERPDLWKVGPIDLTWDDDRKLWTAGQGCGEENPPFVVTNTNDIDTIDEFLSYKRESKCPYRDIYVTLEEDLVKQPDYDETYATRAFIDDMEFSKQPLQAGYRRLVYVKDKCGYCAPMGTKLLCRYNKFTGFYEPLTKPVIIAKGVTSSATQANLTLQYIQGRRSVNAPVLNVGFDNPMGFTVSSGKNAMFTFINGKWTLTAIKE